MVVDDDKSVNHMMADMIKSVGYECYQAFSGAQAREAIFNEKIKPALILCDIKMPDMSGIDLLRETLVKNFDLNFCMITGQSDRSSLLELLQLGAVDVINKPFQMDFFVDTIPRLVAKKNKKDTSAPALKKAYASETLVGKEAEFKKTKNK